MKKIGLDVGSSSIGWAIRENNQITEKGVVTFDSGMMKGQTGGYTSPTKDRREARSKRGLIQARKYRKWQLLKVLLQEFVPLEQSELEIWSKYKKGQIQKFPENAKFLKWLACDFTYLGNDIKYNNPYELRVKALDKKLSKQEFGRALYHLVQRRGYKDIGETDTETEKQKQRREDEGFNEAIQTNRTVAEALTKNFLDKGERARNQYPYRDEYRNELELICKGQGYNISKNNEDKYADPFVQKLWKAIIWQRPLNSQKGNIGKCSLEPTKPRCPASHPVFEIFRTWSFINTIKYLDENGDKHSLLSEFRTQLFEQFFLKQDKNFKFEEIRKFLDKLFKERKKYNYPYNSKEEKYDSTVAGMPVCYGLIKIFGSVIQEAISTIENYHIGKAPKIINGYSIYDLWHIAFEFDENHLKKFAIEKLKIENKKVKRKGQDIEINQFAELKEKFPAGYADLSLKALTKIIPFLKEGFLYNEAVVLAKIPELLGVGWNEEKDKIKSILNNSNKQYNWNKTIVAITNNLIDKYKGLEAPVFAYNDFEYILDEDDIADIKAVSQSYFGEQSWQKKNHKEKILLDVANEYQNFFHDKVNKRAYRQVPTLTKIFEEKLKESEIEIKGSLYHHSDKENRYGTKIKDKKTGMDVLPEARINSIKNPMFNKSMGILRRLMNELITTETIDENTEVIIEIARELNDNNKRIAIERYQRERESKRSKYREFLNEFKEKENKSINVEESLNAFELWTEQTFEKTEDEKGETITNKNRNEILKEKEAIKRYELWMEQKGQCMYTGKMISISQLFSNEIDIEHTIPRSLLPDNTMANQTVCYARYNRDVKRNRIPFNCDNHDKEWNGYTAIVSRLDNWKKLKDYYKDEYDKRIKSFGNEDENMKNSRIQNRHYFKMHYDYWYDKVERFEADEIPDSWARRQLVDTQMITKYAREFLKTYFKKVVVQKGAVTSDFRKLYGFQEEDEIKNRNKHTHHAIDAAVLTLIPTNSSHRDRLLKKMYKVAETEGRQYTVEPFPYFNSQKTIRDIENNTLIVNYENNKMLKQTYRNVRKRGRLQYLKNKNGEFVYDKDGNKILKKEKGDTLRSSLFAQTYLGKIRDVERYDNEQPKRDGSDWKYKSGKNEFLFVKREDIEKVKKSDKLIGGIIDPVIKKLVREQKNNPIVKDYQDNIIRHVRIKTSAGQKVKERLNYRSKHDYKNTYYSEAGIVPYAIFLQRNKNGKIEREMIPVSASEIAKMHKASGKFVIEEYIKQNHLELVEYDDKKLLKVGLKTIVLNRDEEYEKRFDINFQTKRMYVITQFSEGSIWLKYHLEAQSKDEIKDAVSYLKDKMVREYERQVGIPEIFEDGSIKDNKTRRKDYEDRKYRFDNLNRCRFARLSEKIGIEKVKEIQSELNKVKAISSSIEIEGQTPLLKMSKEKWNFLFEGYDFEISLFGKVSMKEEDIVELNEPAIPYQKKNQIQTYTSFEEMNEADAKERANISPEQHLINTTQRIKKMYADELKTPMDKTLKFKND